MQLHMIGTYQSLITGITANDYFTTNAVVPGACSRRLDWSRSALAKSVDFGGASEFCSTLPLSSPEVITVCTSLPSTLRGRLMIASANPSFELGMRRTVWYATLTYYVVVPVGFVSSGSTEVTVNDPTGRSASTSRSPSPAKCVPTAAPSWSATDLFKRFLSPCNKHSPPISR